MADRFTLIKGSLAIVGTGPDGRRPTSPIDGISCGVHGKTIARIRTSGCRGARPRRPRPALVAKADPQGGSDEEMPRSRARRVFPGECSPSVTGGTRHHRHRCRRERPPRLVPLRHGARHHLAARRQRRCWWRRGGGADLASTHSALRRLRRRTQADPGSGSSEAVIRPTPARPTMEYPGPWSLGTVTRKEARRSCDP